MFVTNSVRLASPPQKDLTEFLAALIEDRSDKVHVNQPAFFLHQLRKALFDALAATTRPKVVIMLWPSSESDQSMNSAAAWGWGAWRASMSLLAWAKYGSRIT